MTSPEQGAQQECNKTLERPSGRASEGRRASFTVLGQSLWNFQDMGLILDGFN